MQIAVKEKNTPPPKKKIIFCILSTDSVEAGSFSDIDDEDESSVDAINKDQNVCITLSSEAF